MWCQKRPEKNQWSCKKRTASLRDRIDFQGTSMVVNDDADFEDNFARRQKQSKHEKLFAAITEIKDQSPKYQLNHFQRYLRDETVALVGRT